MSKAYLLLDRSGSMAEKGLWVESINSINEYVKGLPFETDVFIAAFDALSYDVLRNVKRGDFTAISPAELAPRGGTPLYDSTVRLLNRAFEDNDPRTAIVVITDGFENSSRTANLATVRSLIEQVKRKDWQLLFLGANFDKVEGVATSMGIGLAQTMPVNDAYMTRTMGAMSIKTSAYFTSGETFGLSAGDKAAAVGGVGVVTETPPAAVGVVTTITPAAPIDLTKTIVNSVLKSESATNSKEKGV
jgi:hypothetical protein